MYLSTQEDFKVLKDVKLGGRGGYFDRSIKVEWTRFLADGTTLGIGSDGRYYSTDRSVLVDRKVVEVTKEEYFAEQKVA